MDVDVRNSTVNVHEFDYREMATRMLTDIQMELSRPGVDGQQRAAFMPSTAWHTPRFFRVMGGKATGFPGTFVDVMRRSTGGKPAAQLQVAVVDRLVVKVGIRNVRARDAQGHMRYHAKYPCDPATEVARMNAIWRPQTNIVFELVPSDDLEVDHNNPRTQAELGKAYGLKGAATFQADSTVWADKNSGWFEQHRVPGTHLTFFVVRKLHSGGDPVYGKGGSTPNGTMNRANGVSFISDLRVPGTFAHEAGHYIGDMSHQGTDNSLLMRDDGSGYRIPFALAQRFREGLLKRRVL
jgi:hypothetical protein